MINNRYYKWLIDAVYDEGFSPFYTKTLEKLSETPFTWIFWHDESRFNDGARLKVLYNEEFGIDEPVDRSQCSCLEMMVALALRLDNDILYSTRYGSRANVIFWSMIESLGLQEDDTYKDSEATRTLYRFLTRKYEPDGRGGLFTIDSDEDMT